MKKLSAACAMLVLSGCAGMNYALSNYSGVKVVHFTAKSGTGYRVYDKPEENRMMITSTVANAMGQGALKGVTFMDTTPPLILFEQAAIEFLASTGRTCTAKRTFLIVQPQFEVQYDCSTNATQAPAS